MSAGRIIGRVGCPLCPNEAAHVKQSEGKLPYVYCPECGCTLPTRNGVQAGYLLAMTRPDKLAELTRDPSGNPTEPRPAPPPAAAAAPAQPIKPATRASPWAPLIGAMT